MILAICEEHMNPDESCKRCVDESYMNGLLDAASIARKYAHSGESTLRRNVCYAIERRIMEAIDDFQKQRR
jgi:hypothetical protein